KNILIKNQSRCYFCGGFYPKYMICFKSDKDKLDTACRLCHIVTHLNHNYQNEIVLCYSKMSQLDIVRKTVDKTVELGTVPSILEVDPKAKLIDLSIYEFANILISKNNVLPD